MNCTPVLIGRGITIDRSRASSFQGDDVGGVAAGPREEDEGDGGAQHAERVEDPADVDQAHRAPRVEGVCHLAVDEASDVPSLGENIRTSTNETPTHLWYICEWLVRVKDLQGPRKWLVRTGWSGRLFGEL